MTNFDSKLRAYAWLAEQFVGVTEAKVPNTGAMVEKFQRAVDGKASGEPWCVCFVQYVAQQVDELFDRCIYPYPPYNHHRLAPTEWTIGLWESTMREMRRDAPEVGHVVVWRSSANASQGHAGIIVEVRGNDVFTVEGNTGAGNQRDGDGVWKKWRVGCDIPGFTRLGYISPWP